MGQAGKWALGLQKDIAKTYQRMAEVRYSAAPKQTKTEYEGHFQVHRNQLEEMVGQLRQATVDTAPQLIVDAPKAVDELNQRIRSWNKISKAFEKDRRYESGAGLLHIIQLLMRI